MAEKLLNTSLTSQFVGKPKKTKYSHAKVFIDSRCYSSKTHINNSDN